MCAIGSSRRRASVCSNPSRRLAPLNEGMTMTLTQASTHSLFDHCIRALDVLQRIYMRALSYVSPTEDCPAVFGSVFHCNTRQFVQRRIRFFGIFEHNLTYYTLSKLREGDLYVDVGANIGYFSLLASQCVGPTGKVIAVEADPETFKNSDVKPSSLTSAKT